MNHTLPEKSVFKRTFSILSRSGSRETALVVTLLFAAGIAEAVGILSLLPLLTIAMGEAEPGGIVGGVFDAIKRLGFEPRIGPLLVLIVVGLTLKAGLFLLAMSRAGYAGANLATRLRLELIRAMVSARWDYFISQPAGSFTNSISSEGARAAQMYTELCNMLAGVIQVIVYMALALLVSWYITVGAIAFGMVMFFGFNFLIKVSRAAGVRETELYRSLNSRLADGLIAMKPLKAMARERSLRPILESQINDLNRAWRRQVVSRAALSSMQEPVLALLLGIGMFISLTTAGIAFEKLIFMALLFHRIVTRLGNVHVFYQSVTNLESGYWSLLEAIRHAQSFGESLTGTISPTLNRGISLDHVSFSYGAKEILSDISVDIPVNQMTLVAGQSGIGKTTIADIVVGLIRPASGEVLIDGVPLSEVDIEAWRGMIGYVPQEMILLHDSIRVNITLDDDHSVDDQGLSDGRIVEVLRQSGAFDFVSSLPDGIDTIIGERGVRLSGGQRQRISIARALYRRPSLLILDEPTTALDPDTERAICETLVSLKADVTMLAISHQPALTQIADNVVRIDHPRSRTPSR